MSCPVRFLSPVVFPVRMKKRIPIQELRPGMFIASLDQSWFKTPFLRHQWRVRRDDEITLLKSYGIQEVMIDTDQGLDVGTEYSLKTLSPLPNSSCDPPVFDKPALGPDPEEMKSARTIRAEAITTLDNFFRQMEPSTSHNLDQVRGVVSSLLDGILDHRAAMVSLIQMRRFDPDLASHGVDTGVLAMAIGQEHHCDVKALKALGLAALLHDIGQLRLPLNLIQKPTPYTTQDHKLMEGHCEMGLAFLKDFSDIPQESRRMILDHHERLDGSGYPHQLKGTQISQVTQILSIADAYDAQISGRCCNPPVPPARTLSELYRAAIAGQYLLDVVQQLIQLLGVYPIGTLVRLNTNEQALVVWVPSHSRMLPTIKLLKDAFGQPYADHILLDLSAQGDENSPRTIREALDPQQEGWDVGKILEALW
ncbi:MAG: HD-GYP domain-containing protein [Nitrospirales bacterium]